jgi:arylsulfatase A-like enzyme
VVPAPLRAVLLLTSIVGLMCLSLEIELLEQLDSLRLYLTKGEIAADAGLALVLLSILSLVWFGFTMSVYACSSLLTSQKSLSVRVAWLVGLGVPFSYLILEIFAAIRVAFFSQWHGSLFTWIGLGAGFIIIGAGAVYRIDLPKLQEFCRTRLAVIALLHIAFALATLIILRVEGAYLFRNYARQGRAVADSGLPDIYLITMDALRADDMSLYGYYRPTTPSLEKFARKSFVFDYFFSNSNFTTPATTSIETGKLPWSHHLFHAGGFLRGQAQSQTLASVLHAHGYYTAMLSSNYLASPVDHRTLEGYDSLQYMAPTDASGPWLRFTNIVGVSSQYSLYTSLLKGLGGIRFYLGTLVWNHYPYPPEPVLGQARRLLERADITQPRFVWTHIFPPHDPYLPPQEYRTFLMSNKLTKASDYIGLRNTTRPRGITVPELRGRYDEMIRYGDHMVGEYLDWLDRTGRLDKSIVIVTADHGESFEGGWLLHTGPYLTDGLIHIPFMVHLPGQTQGARISQQAEQADILPTVLDLIGVNIPYWTDGVSLKPALKGENLGARLVYSMALESDSTFAPISRGTIAAIDGEFKYVYHLDTHQGSLYRYKLDPAGNHNLDHSEPEVELRLRSDLLNELREVNAGIRSGK